MEIRRLMHSCWIRLISTYSAVSSFSFNLSNALEIEFHSCEAVLNASSSLLLLA